MILKIPTLLLKAQAIQGRKTTKCSVKDKKMSALALQKNKKPVFKQAALRKAERARA